MGALLQRRHVLRPTPRRGDTRHTLRRARHAGCRKGSSGMRRARSAVLTVLVAVGLSVAVGPPTAFAAAPSISDVSPASGAVGTPVTISGTGFTGATSVSFAATEATFTV